MKTYHQNKNKRLLSRSELLNTDKGNASGERTDNRLAIAAEQRSKNRRLSTSDLLNLLKSQAPNVFGIAEVVGKWVWVQFQTAPAAEIRRQLSELGFHWNRKRQAWHHPCGKFSLKSSGDPRSKYQSHLAADELEA